MTSQKTPSVWFPAVSAAPRGTATPTGSTGCCCLREEGWLSCGEADVSTRTAVLTRPQLCSSPLACLPGQSICSKCYSLSLSQILARQLPPAPMLPESWLCTAFHASASSLQQCLCHWLHSSKTPFCNSHTLHNKP